GSLGAGRIVGRCDDRQCNERSEDQCTTIGVIASVPPRLQLRATGDARCVANSTDADREHGHRPPDDRSRSLETPSTGETCNQQCNGPFSRDCAFPATRLGLVEAIWGPATPQDTALPQAGRAGAPRFSLKNASVRPQARSAAALS